MRKIFIHPIGNCTYKATLMKLVEDQYGSTWEYIDHWIFEELELELQVK